MRGRARISRSGIILGRPPLWRPVLGGGGGEGAWGSLRPRLDVGADADGAASAYRTPPTARARAARAAPRRGGGGGGGRAGRAVPPPVPRLVWPPPVVPRPVEERAKATAPADPEPGSPAFYRACATKVSKDCGFVDLHPETL